MAVELRQGKNDQIYPNGLEIPDQEPTQSEIAEIIASLERVTGSDFDYIKSLKNTFQETKFHIRVPTELVPLDFINVLPQPRQTFEKIQEMADSIAEDSLIEPIVIAEFDELHCISHLEFINRVWQTNFQIADLISSQKDGTTVYRVLIAGERRIRGCRILATNGCSTCQKKHGTGSCYERHFGDRNIKAEVHRNIDQWTYIGIQIQENSSNAVPPQQEAQMYYRTFRIIRDVSPKYPLSQFAKWLRKDTQTIRNGIRYCEDLPRSIQQYVDNGELPYTIACDIARYKVATGAADDELEYRAQQAIDRNFTAAEYTVFINSIIANHLNRLRSGQQMLDFDTFQDGNGLLMDMEVVLDKKVVDRKAQAIIHTGLKYLEKVDSLDRNGELGKKDSWYSHKSMVRALLVMARMLLRTRSLLVEKLHEMTAYQEIAEICAQVEPVYTALLKLLPDESPRSPEEEFLVAQLDRLEAKYPQEDLDTKPPFATLL